MLPVKNNKNKARVLAINDRGKFIKVKQPSITELESLYYVLLGNLIKYNQNKNLFN